MGRFCGSKPFIGLYRTDMAVLADSTGLSEHPGLIEFLNPKQGYRIDRPSSWEQTSKAGADVLFTDPVKKSTTVGVTVSPIKIAGLEQFGDVETVRKKLVNTEKQKVGLMPFDSCVYWCTPYNLC